MGAMGPVVWLLVRQAVQLAMQQVMTQAMWGPA
jgi:hypothetical protein